MPLFWHRRDLRAVDNAGLARATDRGPVVPVFVFDDRILEHAGPPRVRAMLDALAELREWYHARGSDLVVVRGDPAVELPALAEDHGADLVAWNRDYSGLARRRDRRVRDALADAGLESAVHDDALLHEPGSITTADDEPYSVFTYFGDKWLDRGKPDPVPPPEAGALADASGESLPTPGDLGFDEPTAEVPDTGRGAARDRLEAFCSGPIFEYAAARDYPAREGTSGLSTALKWGTIGSREVHRATAEALAAAEAAGDEDRIDSVEAFQRQLAWREFYTHVLYFNPEVVTENYTDYENDIEWRDDPAGLRAWKDGETGYPIVDAGMRQLRAEAWMHNRVRMIVASFLTKDLLLDWREGYRWFRRMLADHDTANDNGGWQWAASTGTDAQPYFRVFNPVTQGKRYDPDAEYITEYVPELRGVDAELIHSWDELPAPRREAVAPDYPAPIVDHADRREAALATFERARED